jgi:diguanylate cyclase
MLSAIEYLALFVAALSGAVVVLVLQMFVSRRRASEGDVQLVIASETLHRLRILANRVAADVGHHTNHVEQINAELNAVQGTADDTVLSAVGRLLTANEVMQKQLQSAEERLKAQARQIESHSVEARTDPLTQLANRRALDDVLKRSVLDYQRRSRPATLMLLDVDHFKRFNDTHGHQAGDEVLRGAARILRQTLGDAEIVARYGGEEFAVVFAGSTIEDTLPLADATRAAISAATFHWSGRALRVTVSVGMAELRAGETETEFFRRADEALYAAKKAGRNCGYWNDGRSNHRLKRPETPQPASTAGNDLLAQLLDGHEGDAFVDHLVDRQTFLDEVVQRLVDWKQHGTPLSLLIVQIDNLNRIGSDHGRQAAATVMRIAVQLTMAVVRGLDQATRLNEDTFAVLLPALQLDDAQASAERLRQTIERCRLPPSAKMHSFTVSIGAVEAGPYDDMPALFERARQALQLAIDQGRNRVSTGDVGTSLVGVVG